MEIENKKKNRKNKIESHWIDGDESEREKKNVKWKYNKQNVYVYCIILECMLQKRGETQYEVPRIQATKPDLM